MLSPELGSRLPCTPQMQSSVCTRNSSGGSRRKLFCRRPTPPRCCSGRCSLQGRSTCAKWMVGRPSPQSPSISRLTLPPETIPSCYRRTRHTEFQPHSGRHRQVFTIRFFGYPAGNLTKDKGEETSMFWKLLITTALALPLAYGGGVATAQTTNKP